MATPTLDKQTLEGSLGDILVDVRTGERNTPRPAVLILHGFKGFKDWGMFPPLADRLAQAGLTAVSFNLSGSGADDRGDFSRLDLFRHNTYRRDLEDIDSVLSALIQGRLGVVAPTSIGLIGHSRGGGEAVLMGDDPRLGAIVTWSAIGTIRRWPDEEMDRWRTTGHLDVLNSRTGQVMTIGRDLLQEIDSDADGALSIEQAAACIAVPWLILHGSQDESVPLAEADLLHRAATRDDAVFQVLDGAGHTFGATHPLTGITPHMETAFERTVDWFSRFLT